MAKGKEMRSWKSYIIWGSWMSKFHGNPSNLCWDISVWATLSSPPLPHCQEQRRRWGHGEGGGGRRYKGGSTWVKNDLFPTARGHIACRHVASIILTHPQQTSKGWWESGSSVLYMSYAWMHLFFICQNSQTKKYAVRMPHIHYLCLESTRSLRKKACVIWNCLIAEVSETPNRSKVSVVAFWNISSVYQNHIYQQFS